MVRSGGPWHHAQSSMQYLVWTETGVEGGRHFDAALPEPKRTANYYGEITVLAFPTRPARPASRTSRARRATIAKISRPSPAKYREAPADQVVKAGSIVDLSAHFQNGRFRGTCRQASLPCCGSATR